MKKPAIGRFFFVPNNLLVPAFYCHRKSCRRKKTGPKAGFSMKRYYLAAADAAADAAEAAVEAASTAVEAATAASAAADAATEAAAEASVAGAAGAAGATSTTGAGATTAGSSFLLQAAKATAIREMISKDFFMGFP
jgi:hypothetical protein